MKAYPFDFRPGGSSPDLVRANDRAVQELIDSLGTNDGDICATADALVRRVATGAIKVYRIESTST